MRERTHAVSEALALQQRLTTQAESATRAKSAFLATMSHEIRTPLNAVIATASLLEQTPLTEEQRELVDVIKKGGDSLLSVVSDVLDFSKIEADKLELDSHPFDVRSLMSDTVALVERSAAAKGLQVQADIDPNFPRWVLGDINRLRQVLLNLLSNATKFTERGRIAFSATVQPLDDDDGRVTLTISVSDTGVGIPKDRLLRVFEPFTQADSSTTRRFGGTGLGLAISQHLIRLMGGTLRVTSDVGEGSTFTITLPVALAPAPADDTEPAQRHRPVVAPARAARGRQSREHAGAEENPDQARRQLRCGGRWPRSGRARVGQPLRRDPAWICRCR